MKEIKIDLCEDTRRRARFVTCFLCMTLLFVCNAQGQRRERGQDPTWFFPVSEYGCHAQIPTPRQVLGFDIGEQLVEWEQVLKYMETLSRVSNRVSVRTCGETWEHRPIVQVILTSPENQQDLEAIRKAHLQLSEDRSFSAGELAAMPVVTHITASIHGNEASGANASLLLAYMLAAGETEEIRQLLRESVVIITPGLNPDGINRYAVWCNTARSMEMLPDPNDRHHTEPWPSSRTNHYWADCNRDLLMLQQPEGKSSVAVYLDWLPNVVCDLHEQGGDDKGYYFSPGHPLRTHPLTSARNQELTKRITDYTAKAFDGLGMLYYSKEGYDDYYYGKGAAYGDIHGSVCILYEQLNPKGLLRATAHGPLDFASAVRNQVYASWSSILAAHRMRQQLLSYQADYFKEQRQLAAKDPVKAYVFHANGDPALARKFLENMAGHGIAVYKTRKDVAVNGLSFSRSDSYIIPTDQKYHAMVHTIWDCVSTFRDSVFYDISTWTFPYAYGLTFAALKNADGLIGEAADLGASPERTAIPRDPAYAYLVKPGQLYAPALVYALLQNQVYLKAAHKTFTADIGGRSEAYPRGTIIIPTGYQTCSQAQLLDMVEVFSKKYGVEVETLSSGLMKDVDLGSPGMKSLRIPKIAVVATRGMSVTETGEWRFLLDRYMHIPVTLLEADRLTACDLTAYNVLIFANGSPTGALPEAFCERLKAWVAGGGTLILTGKAYKVGNAAGLTDIKAVTGHAGSVSGAILKVIPSVEDPLCYGYARQETHVMKLSAATVTEEHAKVFLRYAAQPWVSGCISPENTARIAGSPAAFYVPHGKGKTVYFADNLFFRSYWFAGVGMMCNSLFY